MQLTVPSGRALALAAALAASLVALPFATAGAQDTGTKVVTPQLDFSGVILGNFRAASDSASQAANGGQSPNKFDIERVYLNFRMPAGNDGSIRVTTDVYNGDQSSASYYKGWTVRLKFAYFQYNFLHDIGGSKGFNAVARIGALNTTLIEHEEGFWPRYLSQVAEERNGFFSSSDLGVAGLLTLPNKWGEVYASVANGPGYGAAEGDPYKDYSARLSLTPLANSKGVLKSFTISPWFYIGKTASRFLAGGAGQAGPVTSGLTRDRAGVFVGIKDRRLTGGFDYGTRTETVELGANTAASPRTTYDNSGTLTGGFVQLRPFELGAADPKHTSPLVLFVRVDNFKPYSDARSAGAQTTGAANQLLIAGASWDLNSKATFSVDLQDQKPKGGSKTPESKILFVHWQVTF